MSTEVRGWQEGLTLSARQRHMLETGLYSDVIFEVGATGEEVSAHRHMLVSASPVFEAMFHGKMAVVQGGKVRVEDIEPDIFKGMLSYIYTDDATVTKDNALFLMYAAKKYILPVLEEKCTTYLENNINENTASTILTHSIQFSRENLQKRCLEFMAEKAEDVLKNEDFLSLSHEALVSFLSLDKISISDETEIFQAAIRWAESHISTRGEPVTDSGIRTLLGDALYAIRLPSADMKKFVKVCGRRDVLTAEEKSVILCHAIEEEEANSPELVAGFQTKIRCKPPLPRIIKRFTTMASGWGCASQKQAVCFQVSRQTRLKGIGVYGPTRSQILQNVTLSVFEGDTGLYNTTTNITCNVTSKIGVANLQTPLNLKPAINYTVCAVIAESTYYGTSNGANTTCDGLTVAFSDSPMSSSGHTTTRAGQIPELHFI